MHLGATRWIWDDFSNLIYNIKINEKKTDINEKITRIGKTDMRVDKFDSVT